MCLNVIEDFLKTPVRKGNNEINVSNTFDVTTVVKRAKNEVK